MTESKEERSNGQLSSGQNVIGQVPPQTDAAFWGSTIGSGREMLIGYARVSTQDQKLDLQLDALKSAGCGRVFTDKARGATAERPGLDAALAYLREGDTLVCWKLDRLGRSLRHLVETVNALNDCGIGFKSLQESIDTASITGKLFFHIMASLAEFERELTSERTRAGLVAARARGRMGGRKPKCTASKITQARALLRDPDITFDEVCKTLRISARTLRRHKVTRQSVREEQKRTAAV